MTGRELLEDYRQMVLEVDTLERQCAYINRIVGGPTQITGIQITGMPRGTNEPEAARLQRADYVTDETDMAILRKLEQRVSDLTGMMDMCEMVLDSVTDQKARTILRNYYALGWTDKRIARLMNYERSSITKIRMQAMDALDKPVNSGSK